MHHERSHKNDFFKQFFSGRRGFLLATEKRRERSRLDTGYMVGRKEGNKIREFNFKLGS
jgi:hypothetical protein